MQIRLTPLAASLALAFLAPLPLLAQTTTSSASSAATDSNGQPLPTVTVNASADASAEGVPQAYSGGQVGRGGRMGFLGNKDFMETPFNGTSYTQELIKNQQAQGIGDVLQNDPSVRIARGFGNFQELYMIRGLQLYSDDLAYNGLYGLLPRQYVATELLERVEVLRGASAFLNGMTPGSTGLGGTVNLLPKRATVDPVSQATVGWETGGQLYTAADIGRRFGPDDRLGVRVNAVRRKGGTSIDKEDRELGLVSVGVDYRGNNFRLSADLGYQEQKLTQGRPSVALGGNFLPALPSNTSNGAQPWTYSNERDLFSTLRAEFDLSQNTTAWLAYGSRVDTENNRLAGLTVTGTDGTAATYRADNARVDFVRTGEAGIRTKFNTAAVKHEISATASVYKQDMKNAYAWSAYNDLTTNLYSPTVLAMPATTTLAAAGGDMANPRTTEYVELTSYALADTLSFMDDRLQVTLGARYQKVKDANYYYLTAAPKSLYEQSAVTPLAAAVFKLNKSFSLYGNFVQGLQKGDTAPNNAANPGQTFSPYKAKQKEVGLKYDGGNIGGSLALFTLSKPNYITLNNYYAPSGEQRNRGAEFSVFGTPMRGLKLLGGLTLIDAKQIATDSATTEGKYAVGVPKTQANIGAEWSVPGVQGLSLDARAIYTGSQYANATNTIELPSWTRYDVGARYMMPVGSQVITIRARVDNLFNKNYWGSVSPAFNNYLVQGNPRTLVVSASVDF